jgi:hypothetical protein
MGLLKSRNPVNSSVAWVSVGTGGDDVPIREPSDPLKHAAPAGTPAGQVPKIVRSRGKFALYGVCVAAAEPAVVLARRKRAAVKPTATRLLCIGTPRAECVPTANRPAIRSMSSFDARTAGPRLRNAQTKMARYRVPFEENSNEPFQGHRGAVRLASPPY